MSFGFPLQVSSSFADPDPVTTFLASRRRAATAPRRRIVSVSDHWRLVDGSFRREVVVELPGGGRQRGYMPDESPELLAYLSAVAA